MKPQKIKILFFVRGGVVTDSHKAEATTIATATGGRVMFRDGPIAALERAETCDGVAGAVPDNYGDRPKYDATGALVDIGTPVTSKPQNLNSLGLPEGSPDNVQDLRDALKAAGVAFHPNMKPEKLAALYLANVQA